MCQFSISSTIYFNSEDTKAKSFFYFDSIHSNNLWNVALSSVSKMNERLNK